MLTAGDSYTIDRGGLTLIEAQETAAVCVMAHYVDEVRHPAQPSRRVGAASARGSRRCSRRIDMGGYSPVLLSAVQRARRRADRRGDVPALSLSRT